MSSSHDQLLRDIEPDQVGIYLPFPVNSRLDALVDRVNEAGARASRGEVVAALVLECPESAAELKALLQRYRVATAEKARVKGMPVGAFLHRAPRGRGRRARFRPPVR